MTLAPCDIHDHGMRVTCNGCGRRVRMGACHADRDGKAFEAYYCLECVQVAVGDGRATIASVTS